MKSMYRKEKIAVVIPAYNEERLIKPTLEGVPPLIDKIYVINDGSKDNTIRVVKEVGDKRVEILNHSTNRGLGQAIITGYLKSAKDGYDIIVVVGGDNQMDLAEVTNFLDPLIEDKADFTKGNRFLRYTSTKQSMPKIRFIGNSLLSILTKFASGYWRIYDSNDGYTAIKRWVIESVDWSKAAKGYGYNGDWQTLFNLLNVRIKDVPRRAIYLDGERQSQIKIHKYVLRTGSMLVRRFFWRIKHKYVIQNFHPLALFYYTSFLFIPLGVLISLFVVYLKLSHQTITGTTAILSAIFIITGFQSFLFAILFDHQDNEKLQP